MTMDLNRQREENQSIKRILQDDVKDAYKRVKEKRNKVNYNLLKDAIQKYWNEFVTYDPDNLTWLWQYIIKLPKGENYWFVDKLNHYDLRENIWELIPDTLKSHKKVNAIIKKLLYNPKNTTLQTLVKDYAGQDDLRPVMTTTYFGENEIVTTDSHKMLYLYKKDLIKNANFTEGSYALTTKSESIYGKNTNNSLQDRNIITDRYPNYEAVIPLPSENRVIIDTQQFYDLCLTLKKSRVVNYMLRLTGDFGEVQEFAMNLDFVLDGLKTALLMGWKKILMDCNTQSSRAKLFMDGSAKNVADVRIDKTYSKTSFILIMPLMENYTDMSEESSRYVCSVNVTNGELVSAKQGIKLFDVKGLEEMPKITPNITKLKSEPKRDEKEPQKTIRVKWGQNESTQEWMAKEYGSYEDSGKSPSHVVGILEREYDKDKPYLEITIDEANTIKESAQYQNGAWTQDEINPDNENPPLKYYDTVMKGYVDRINKELEKAKETPSENKQETEKIGGRKRKRQRKHKTTIREQKERQEKERKESDKNEAEEYRLKIELYQDLIDIAEDDKEVEEYELKIDLYQDLIELAGEDADDEYSFDIVDEETGEVTQMTRKKGDTPKKKRQKKGGVNPSEKKSEETCASDSVKIKGYDPKEGEKIVNKLLKKHKIKVEKWSVSSCGYAYWKRDKDGYGIVKIPKPTNADRFGVCLHEIKHIIDGKIRPSYLAEFRCDKYALDYFEDMNLDITEWKKRMRWHVLSRVAMATNRGHRQVNKLVKDFYPDIDFESWYGKRVFVWINTPKGIGRKNPKFWDYIQIDISNK